MFVFIVNKVKRVGGVFVDVMKSCRGSRGIALILNLVVRCGRSNFSPHLLNARKKEPSVPIEWEAGWAPLGKIKIS